MNDQAIQFETMDQYAALTGRTESMPMSLPGVGTADSNLFAMRFLHHCMGMVTEAGELMQISITTTGINLTIREQYVEEIGDGFWYIGRMSDVMGVSLDSSGIRNLPDSDFVNTVHKTRDLPTLSAMAVVCAGDMMDCAKRFFYYGKPLDRERFLKEFASYYCVLSRMCDLLQITEKEVARRNLAKLYKRYPEKFDSDKAHNRDLAAEQSVLRESSQKGDVQ